MEQSLLGVRAWAGGSSRRRRARQWRGAPRSTDRPLNRCESSLQGRGRGPRPAWNRGSAGGVRPGREPVGIAGRRAEPCPHVVDGQGTLSRAGARVSGSVSSSAGTLLAEADREGMVCIDDVPLDDVLVYVARRMWDRGGGRCRLMDARRLSSRCPSSGAVRCAPSWRWELWCWQEPGTKDHVNGVPRGSVMRADRWL